MSKKNNFHKNKIITWICSILISGVLLALLCFSTHSNLFIVNTACLWILGWVYLSIFCYFLTFGHNLQNELFQTVVLKIVSGVISLIIVILFPIRYGDVLTSNYLERQIMNTDCVKVTPLKESNSNSTAAEIWIDQVLINYQESDLNRIILPDGWQILDNKIYCEDARTAEPLVFSIPQKCYYEIRFIETEASGMIQYSVGEASVRIDLYSKDRCNREVSPEEIWGRVTYAPAHERIVYYIAHGILLWILVDAAVCFIYSHYRKKHEVIKSFSKKSSEN